jgi:signal transduction histidine kinase
MLIEQGVVERSKGELSFQTGAGTFVPVLLSCSSVKFDGLQGVCLVATDLTEQKYQAELVNKRTVELWETNLQLQREIEERKQTENALKEVRQRLNQSQEMERLLLARELHDGPLQEVIAMSFELSLLSLMLEAEGQVSKVDDLNKSVQRTASHLRLITQTLRPPVLAHMGLAAAVEAHLKQVQEIRESPLLTFTCSEETWSVPEDISIALLRIVQQAVQNALQHAQADLIEVVLHYDDDRLQLEIKDNGRGFRKPFNRIEFAREGHLGVVGMAERAEAILGKFEVLSQPGQGTSICVIIPKPPENSDRHFKE